MKDFHFGENLRLVRITKDISQKAMAHYLEISQPTYSRLESDQKVPNHAIVSGMAKVLGVQLAQLLPQSRLVYKAKAILDSPFGYIYIIVCFCALSPAAWGITDAVCVMNGVSEDTTVILRRLTIPLVIIVIWYGLSRVKKGDKYD
ncbi:MAG: helix-turn-helix transcriptional regulator [Bacteroidota bacterium]